MKIHSETSTKFYQKYKPQNEYLKLHLKYKEKKTRLSIGCRIINFERSCIYSNSPFVIIKISLNTKSKKNC